MLGFSHLASDGRLAMVDVSDKNRTQREAMARGEITLSPHVIEKIKTSKIAKGNVLEAARLAGILAAKKTDQLIPLCHSIPLDSISIDFEIQDIKILIEATARCTGKTGVEMEALTAATVAGLTIYDMCKALDKSMAVGPFVLQKKSGGRSGTFDRGESKE